MEPTLYNARTKQLEPVAPLDGKTVRMYTCGPTVYDHAHIGNLVSFIFADTLRRMLHVALAGTHNVRHVMNYTDVDDKTIKRSQQEYPDDAPETALKNLTRTYEQLFLADMQSIGNQTEPLALLRATESIAAMQQVITQLHQQGIAYTADDGVYFSITEYQKTRTYGQLSTITTQNTSAERINNDEYDKTSAHDFALWKAAKPGEPTWEFQLDGHNLPGRPGWHIECSAMSVGELGQPFDIHTGGIDLQFPHHENEIAQSTAGDQPELYANFFCYNEHLLVDGKKMSKSLNNFYTLVDVIEHGYDPLAFRLLALQSHYRSQLNFSWESLSAAQNRLRDLQAMADMRFQPVSGRQDAQSATRQADSIDFAGYSAAMLDKLAADVNTPAVLAVLSEASARIQRGAHQQDIPKLQEFLRLVDSVLGLGLLQSKDISENAKQSITDRQKARDAQDWAESDRLRDLLAGQGIGLRDTKHGAMWFRI